MFLLVSASHSTSLSSSTDEASLSTAGADTTPVETTDEHSALQTDAATATVAMVTSSDAGATTDEFVQNSITDVVARRTEGDSMTGLISSSCNVM